MKMLTPLTVIEFRRSLAKFGAAPDWIMCDDEASVTIVWYGRAETFECSPDGVREAAMWYAGLELQHDEVTVH